MFDRRIVSNFNWLYFFAILTVSIIGVITIYSANHARPEEFFRGLYIKQIYWIAYGLLAMLAALVIDYRWFSRYAYLIYALTILGLGFVLVNGIVVSGSKRWIHIGSTSIQVSEFAKIAIVIVLAKYFESGKLNGKYNLRNLIIPALLTAILGGFIVVQPDLGTTMMILFIFLAFILAIEINRMTMIKLFIGGLALAPAPWYFLKDYQKTRVLTLFNPELDPLGAGYHWGKGLFAGTQSRLNFLPEKHTDFIFSVFAEETGFMGVILLLSLFTYIILKGLNIAFRAGDRFGFFLALGLIISISFYMIFNIGMTVGIFPITGIPLPFLSYGGSSLVTNFFSIGLLLNIEMRRTLH